MTQETLNRGSRGRRTESRQAGFTLVVAVIFLSVLTILGISAMRMSAVAERMASSHQHLNVAFQTAETGLALSFSNLPDIPVLPLENPEEGALKLSYEVITGDPIPCNRDGEWCGADAANPVLNTRTWYVTESNVSPPGYSLDGPFRTHHFSSSSEARLGTIHVRLAQGFRRIGPRSTQ
jgi:hypothetical protein